MSQISIHVVAALRIRCAQNDRLPAEVHETEAIDHIDVRRNVTGLLRQSSDWQCPRYAKSRWAALWRHAQRKLYRADYTSRRSGQRKSRPAAQARRAMPQVPNLGRWRSALPKPASACAKVRRRGRARPIKRRRRQPPPVGLAMSYASSSPVNSGFAKRIGCEIVATGCCQRAHATSSARHFRRRFGRVAVADRPQHRPAAHSSILTLSISDDVAIVNITSEVA